MTYRQIEQCRETRLWLSQVIIPAAMIGCTILANPNARNYVAEKADKAKRAIKNKFKRA